MRKRTMADVKAANAAAGQYFFFRSTMRFFGSRVESSLYTGGYFITSEKAGFTSAQRRFTIRRETADHSIETVSKFLEYRTIEIARVALRKIQRGEA
jgi:hypothetical protein